MKVVDALRGRVRNAVALLALLGAGLIVASMTTVQPTQAAFTDTATVQTGTLAAHTMAANAQPACKQTGIIVFRDVNLTWPQVDSRYTYAIRFTDPNGNVETSTLGAGVATGGTVTFNTAHFSLFETTGTYKVEVTAQIAGSPWKAPTTTTTTIKRAFVTGWSCG